MHSRHCIHQSAAFRAAKMQVCEYGDRVRRWSVVAKAFRASSVDHTIQSDLDLPRQLRISIFLSFVGVPDVMLSLIVQADADEKSSAAKAAASSLQPPSNRTKNLSMVSKSHHAQDTRLENRSMLLNAPRFMLSSVRARVLELHLNQVTVVHLRITLTVHLHSTIASSITSLDSSNYAISFLKTLCSSSPISI
jgi:hypothetical protein